MPEELGVLFVSDPIVDQGQSISVLHQKTTHRPSAQVVGIGCMALFPDRLGHHTEHGTTIELEETGIDHV